MTMCASSQKVGIGEWDSYFTLTNMYDVAEADQKIVWVSELSALYYDIEDQTVNELNKIDGLTQTGFTRVAYNASNKTIVFGYNDGNIDLVMNALNSPALILRNTSQRKNYVGVELKGAGLNTKGVGAKAFIFYASI